MGCSNGYGGVNRVGVVVCEKCIRVADRVRTEIDAVRIVVMDHIKFVVCVTVAECIKFVDRLRVVNFIKTVNYCQLSEASGFARYFSKSGLYIQSKFRQIRSSCFGITLLFGS